jgi:DNA-binding NtrC family response regulator
MVERMFISSDKEIGTNALPELVEAAETSDGTRIDIPLGTSIEEAERRIILTTLEHLEGDKPRAANVLGISLKTLYNRLKKYHND